MDHTSFQHWMTNIEKLDSVQYQQAKAAFSGEFEELEVAMGVGIPGATHRHVRQLADEKLLVPLDELAVACLHSYWPPRCL